MSSAIWIILIIVFIILVGVAIFLAIFFVNKSNGGNSSISLPAVEGVKTSFATNNGGVTGPYGGYNTYSSGGTLTGCSPATDANAVGFITENGGTGSFTMQLYNVHIGDTGCMNSGTTWASGITISAGETKTWNSQTIQGTTNVYFTLYPNCAVNFVGSMNGVGYIGNVNPLTQYVRIKSDVNNNIAITVENT